MMLREVRYGINIGLKDVEVDPLTSAPFHFSFGDVSVRYSANRVEISLPGDLASSQTKSVVVTGLAPDGFYALEDGCATAKGKSVDESKVAIRADIVGRVTFDATFASSCAIILSLEKS